MKRLIPFVIGMLCATAGLNAQLSNDEKIQIINTYKLLTVSTPGDQLNVRAEPNAKARTVEVVPDGRQIRVKVTDAEWVEVVTTDWNRGWVKRKFIHIPSPDLPVWDPTAR
jgi:SH3-like domain-containing protein